MIYVLIGSLIMGFSILLIFKKEYTIMDIILLPIPIGIAINTILFLILAFFKVLYNKYLFIVISIFSIITVFYNLFKNKNKLKFKRLESKIPFYYILIFSYIIIRLFIITSSSFINFQNNDEFTAYHTITKQIYVNNDFSGMYTLYSPMSYFIGTMTYSFDGINLTSARMFSPIFFGLIALFIYYALSNHKVNRHIAALVSILFMLSSCENLFMASIFYNSLYFSLFFLYGLYFTIDSLYLNDTRQNKILGYLFLILTVFTRRECFFYIPIVIFILSLKRFLQKKIKFKKFILSILIPIIITILWLCLKKILFNPIVTNVSASQSLSIFDTIKLRIPDSLKFISAAVDKTLLNNSYYFNGCTFIIFIIFLFTIVFLMTEKMQKVKIKNEQIYRCMKIVLLIQLIYIGIVVFSEYAFFAYKEFLMASYFSKYILAILPINFILLGLYIFSEENDKSLSNQLTKK